MIQPLFGGSARVQIRQSLLRQRILDSLHLGVLVLGGGVEDRHGQVGVRSLATLPADPGLESLRLGLGVDLEVYPLLAAVLVAGVDAEVEGGVFALRWEHPGVSALRGSRRELLHDLGLVGSTKGGAQETGDGL